MKKNKASFFQRLRRYDSGDE